MGGGGWTLGGCMHVAIRLDHERCERGGMGTAMGALLYVLLLIYGIENRMTIHAS